MARPEQSGSLAMMAGVDESVASKRARSKEAWQRQWKDMMQRGIACFMAEEPEMFRQRLQRGIPMAYRWEVWKAAAQTRREDIQRRRERAEVGECLESSEWLRHERGRPGFYQELLAKENQWTSLIEIDISRTFPEVPLFDKEQQQSLLRVLQAYANLNPEVGYCQGMNFVAGLLLFVSQKGDFRETPRLETEEETFWMFASLMEDWELQGFYRRNFPLLMRFLGAFDQVFKEKLPDLREHFLEENIQHVVYLHQWFLTLFINSLPLPMVLIIWDSIVCCGVEVMLPIAVALLGLLRDTLMAMHFEEIVCFFKMMRAEDSDVDTVAIAQMVVKIGHVTVVPDGIAAGVREEFGGRPRQHEKRRRLRSATCEVNAGEREKATVGPSRSVWSFSVDRLREDRDDSDDDSEGTLADAWVGIKDSSSTVDGQEGGEATVSGSIATTASLLGGYLGQFSVSELPQGVFDWWGRAGG
mmetsp:Transcript_29310/g.62306  ORF Transcript_29310/g.62306 Transcript_29310/m.62306 type:complete len:471 (-) Transcript_29310:13-1425(-)